MINHKKKVAVALSGGVDSSVAAALLKQGACPEFGRRVEVLGFHLRFWKAKENKAKSKEVENRVKKIGEVLDIPIKFFDVKENFKKIVQNYFLKELKSGRTPNTCVVCNREIKFKFLLEKAKAMKCDYLATGHYARLRPAGYGGQARLLRAKDKKKDQSYFLWGVKLTQEQWGKILFPIGEMESKQKVRQIAKEFGLPTFQTPSSSDVCFLGSLDFTKFLQKQLGNKKGKIIDKKGASEMINELISSGATLCFIADQDAGRKGIFVDFFSRKASTYKSIGLLAITNNIPIGVGYSRRVGNHFFFEIGIERIIYPDEWKDKDNPLEWVTAEYTKAIESFVRKDPTQYWWLHRRWRHRPKEEQNKLAQDGMISTDYPGT